MTDERMTAAIERSIADSILDQTAVANKALTGIKMPVGNATNMMLNGRIAEAARQELERVADHDRR